MEEQKRMSFSSYKNARKSVEEVQSLIKNANENKKKSDYIDSRMFRYTKDKVGNAYIILRFLPSSTDLPPVISKFSHFFDNKGKWYVEDCPTTIKQPCPVCRSNSDLFNSGIEASVAVARRRKRRKEYFSNVYILKDTNNPDNEGKVMIWNYGQKVYDKIMNMIQPELDSQGKPVEEPIDIFDLFNGANFKLKIKTIGGFSNYDDASFSSACKLFEDDKQAEEVYNKIYDLKEFVNPANIKAYSELEKRFKYVTSDEVLTQTAEAADGEERDSTPAPTIKSKKAEEPVFPKNTKEDEDDDETVESEKMVDGELDTFFKEL